MTMKKPTPSRVSQLLFLAAFIILFLMTEYRGSDRIVAAVNGFFRANPLTSGEEAIDVLKILTAGTVVHD